VAVPAETPDPTGDAVAPPPGGDGVVVSTTAPDADAVGAALALVAAAERADGVPPVSEQQLLRLREGGTARHLLAHDAGGRLVGLGVLDAGDDPDGPLVAELVVAPDARRRGTGGALLRAAREAAGTRPLRLWMHGALPGARALAAREGLVPVRELLTMGTTLDDALPPLPEPDGVRLRAFVPGADEEAWLGVNRRAFATHPEQGAWTLDDVLAREREPWFDPEGLLLAEDAATGALLGSHWTKTTPTADGGLRGEVYVVGVDPSAQGRGVGRLVTLAGLHHLRGRGVREVDLYVEGDNAAALAVYSRLGFARTGADVLVAAPAAGGTR